MNANEYNLSIDINDFIETTWQKKPVIFKNAFNQFQDPISADELAGLACEEDISSRVVITKGSNWEVQQGPFEDYQAFGETHWQLLVQAVNHWYGESQPLVEAFRFLPDWRFDDLMVSFATKHGGVGPHIDNYDVFIIQGSGERRWLVGDEGIHNPRNGDQTSPLVDDFEPIIDQVLQPGDVLYIPPGFPHCGDTLSDTALSYSIGFRAPSQQELLTQLADSLIDDNKGHKRFESTNASQHAGVVDDAAQQGMMSLLIELAQDKQQYQTILGKLLSQSRFELDIVPQEPMSLDSLTELLEEGAQLQRIGGLKIIALENDDQQRVFINGEQYQLQGIASSDIEDFVNHVSFSPLQAKELITNPALAAVIIDLLDQGLFYLA
ncbi:JmjC domain-containing protein [Shewanella maritima]|uniref:ribosomal protein uL16 3-hydroxylase n=1 Tax=Shewanella maritima TaxID=2520507 RepID=UPI003735E72D